MRRGDPSLQAARGHGNHDKGIFGGHLRGSLSSQQGTEATGLLVTRAAAPLGATGASVTRRNSEQWHRSHGPAVSIREANRAAGNVPHSLPTFSLSPGGQAALSERLQPGLLPAGAEDERFLGGEGHAEIQGQLQFPAVCWLGFEADSAAEHGPQGVGLFFAGF